MFKSYITHPLQKDSHYVNMKESLFPLFVIVLSVSVGMLVQYEGFFDPYLANLDARLNTYPFYTVQDPALYPNDRITQYLMESYTPGHRFIYTIASQFIDPILFGKILSIILAGATALAAYSLGRTLKDRWLGLIAGSIMSVAIWAFSFLAGGHQRAFSVVLILCALIAIKRYNLWLLTLILCTQLLIYPMAALITIGLYGLLQLNRRTMHQLFQKKIPKSFIHATIIFIAFGFLAYIIYPFDYNSNLGSPVTLEEMRNSEIFSIPGSYQRIPFEDPITLSIYYLEEPVLYLIMIGVALAIVLRINPFKLPKEILALLATGFIISACSYLLGYRLYDYHRYILHTVPIVAVFLLSFIIWRIRKR